MKCTNCGNEQNTGKFCGSCGTSLAGETGAEQGTAYEEVAGTAEPISERQNNNVETVKEATRQYGSFAIKRLKRPASSLDFSESFFFQGIATIVVYALALALSLYFLANTLYKAAMGGFGSLLGEAIPAASLPFFTLTMPVFFVTLLLIGATIITVFGVSKLMKVTLTLKGAVSQYGGLLVPFAAVNLIMILAALMGSPFLFSALAAISVPFTLFFLAGFFMFEYAYKYGKTDRIYWGVGTILAAMVINYVIIRMIVMDMLESSPIIEMLDLL